MTTEIHLSLLKDSIYVPITQNKNIILQLLHIWVCLGFQPYNKKMIFDLDFDKLTPNIS